MVEALEFAYATAYRKMIPGADTILELRGEADERKGELRIFAMLKVVDDEDYTDKFNQVPLSLARKKDPEVVVGDQMEFNVTPKNFGRIAVQTAKQTMMQRLRYAEKEKLYEEFKDRAGDIVSGTVRRFEKNDVMVDLGKFEGRMPQRERVTTEDYNIGDRIRAYVVSVENEGRGPEIILSRSHPAFVRRLFESEVPEISDRTIELRGLAREAGYRTKVAVASNDDNVDPVGACVGLRGARVKNIVRELNNEKVDIIRWDENLEEFVKEALKPAKIVSTTVSEEDQTIYLTVDEEDLSKAIGRRGQNARLTSKLIGWEVQIRKDESQHEIFEAKVADASLHLAEALDLEPDLAHKVFLAGGASPDIIIQMPEDYLAANLGEDAEMAGVILERARTLLGAGESEGDSAEAAGAEEAGAEAEAGEGEVAEAEAPAPDEETEEALGEELAES